MGALVTREQVLEALNIENFRQMTSDKVLRFASMYHQMDPEVAKAAIAQFPTFSKIVGEALSDFKDTITKTIEGDDENTRMSMQARLNIIDSMQTILDKGDLSFEEEKTIIEMMSHEASKMDEQVAEGKKFKIIQQGLLGVVMVGLGGILLTALGGKGEFKLPQLPR